MRPIARVIVGILSITLVGCASIDDRQVPVTPAALTAYLANKPTALHTDYTRLFTEGPRNAVLNNMLVGRKAFALGEYAAAAGAFDAALLGIESVYADNPEAAQARQIFTPEAYKDFKGEPYERAMAYYYRGLLYLLESDYENARASFKSGMLQDSMSYSESYQQDFAVLAFLEGWASHCHGDVALAADGFNEAARLNSALALPGHDQTLLVIGEFGGAPVKRALGQYGETLGFSIGRQPRAQKFNLIKDQQVLARSVHAEDLFFQASTRGGRTIDAILDGKAQFKTDAKTAGQVLTTAGLMAATSNNQDTAYAGLAVAVVGLLMHAAAAAAKPDADVRAWNNLPGMIHLATLSEDSPNHSVAFQRLNSSQEPIDSQPLPVQWAGKGRCKLFWYGED